MASAASCSSPSPRGGSGGAHLSALAAAAEVGEEHERAPLLLHLAKEVALRAGDEADGLRRHLDHGQVVVLVVVVDGDRPDALGHDALDVPAHEQASAKVGEPHEGVPPRGVHTACERIK